MQIDLPHDADGDALRRLVAAGSDLSKPMEIEFCMAVPDEQSGRAFAAVAIGFGFRADIDKDDDSGDWTCYCTKTMLASHAAILLIQQELAMAGARFGASIDGWGSYGNAQN
ncbi:MAG: ribonuclease E inhibitor RraB [Phycisphaerales bacterium]